MTGFRSTVSARTILCAVLLGALAVSGASGLARAEDAATNDVEPAAQVESAESDKSAVTEESATAEKSAESAESEWGPKQVVIYKADRSLALFRHGKFDKRFPVVLGRKPVGTKRWQHDARTPEGYYHVTEKRPHDRWQTFIEIDYPNRWDRKRYKELVEAGRVPVIDGQRLGIGGDIGIHGSDKPEEQSAGTDWTLGCVSLHPEDVAELAEFVEVGTPVWILE